LTYFDKNAASTAHPITQRGPTGRVFATTLISQEVFNSQPQGSNLHLANADFNINYPPQKKTGHQQNECFTSSQDALSVSNFLFRDNESVEIS